MDPAHQRNLDALEQALNGHPSQHSVDRVLLDPARHLLSLVDYQQAVPGGAPLSLADEAQEMRQSLAADDAAEHPRGYYPDDWNPTLAEVQAMTVGTLLQELATRLVATGDPGGRALAEVTLKLADEVLAPTVVGAQR